MNIIRQGGTFDFDFDLSGSDVSGFTVTINVLQYPGDSPTITRVLTYSDDKFIGTLTSAETSALAVGQWFVHFTAEDSDENLREPIKLYIAKGWV